MTHATPLALSRTLLAAVSIGIACSGAVARAGSPKSEPSLRQAARNRFLVGTAVMSQQLQDPRVAHLVSTQFDCITGENEFKPDETEPRPGHFTFGPADKIIAFAEQHDMKVVGHNLCWHSQTPRWMYQAEDGKPLSREAALANLKRHIDNVAGHFRGKVIGWDVVNEALSDTPGEYLRNSPAKRAIGDDFIIQAFRFAHEADPGAELYYNDYSNENPDKLQKNLRLIHDLKAAHVPITAVGIQCHFALIYPEAIERLDKAVTAYANAGVKVMFTELDVDVLPRNSQTADISATQKEGLNPYTHGLPENVAQQQADFYANVFRIALKHPGVVTRITLWGVDDGSSWLNNFPVRGRTNYALLWDRQLKPKPAFNEIMQVLTAPQPENPQ